MDWPYTNFSSFRPSIPPPGVTWWQPHMFQHYHAQTSTRHRFQYIMLYCFPFLFLRTKKSDKSVRFTKAPTKQRTRVFTMPQWNDKCIHTNTHKSSMSQNKNRVSACTLGQTSSWSCMSSSVYPQSTVLVAQFEFCVWLLWGLCTRITTGSKIRKIVDKQKEHTSTHTHTHTHTYTHRGKGNTQTQQSISFPTPHASTPKGWCY